MLNPKRILQVYLNGAWHAVAASPAPVKRGWRNGGTHCGLSFKELRVGETVKTQDVAYLNCTRCEEDARRFVERDRKPLLGRARETLAKLTPAEQRALFQELKLCTCHEIADLAGKSPATAVGMIVGGILGAALGAVAGEDKKGRLH